MYPVPANLIRLCKYIKGTFVIDYLCEKRKIHHNIKLYRL